MQIYPDSYQKTKKCPTKVDHSGHAETNNKMKKRKIISSANLINPLVSTKNNLPKSNKTSKDMRDLHLKFHFHPLNPLSLLILNYLY